MSRRFAILIVILACAAPFAAQAQTIPFSVRQAVVRVVCGELQGSGVVVNSEKGYVLTNAHLLVGIEGLQSGPCTVSFLADSAATLPRVEYQTSQVAYAFEESANRDFAILQIGTPVRPNRTLDVFPFLKTDEFSTVGTPISIVSYPGSASGAEAITTGTIHTLADGIIGTDAAISPGSSGGGGITNANNLVGLATRILSSVSPSGVERIIEYQLVDIRAIEAWMDTLGSNGHDTYVTHADETRAHAGTNYVMQTQLQCILLARTPYDSSVSCLKADSTRTIFPNAGTFFTWFGDFSGVLTLSPQELTPYRLVGSVTMKPGTLVKITTDPKVYLVTDIFGTLRWVENEDIARLLYGDGWAGFVKDVPDEFFTNYRVGAAIQ